MNKTIGVVGSRRRNTPADYEAIKAAVLRIYQPGDDFVSGGCPQGGDRFCELIAKDLRARITIYYANWGRLGPSAGFQRNGLIAADADVLIACVAPDRLGGTEDTITKFCRKEPAPAAEALILV